MRAVHAEDGITLVEIMISLLVLGVVLSAFFQVITGGLRSLSDSNNRQDASQIATDSIETLRALSPPEIAMLVDPLAAPAGEVDLATFPTCTASVDHDDDPVTANVSVTGFDPDGAGPIPCEQIVQSPQGAITSTAPFNATINGVDLLTVATFTMDGAGVQDGVVRVTAVSEYDIGAGAEVIRRQAYFSEINRGA